MSILIILHIFITLCLIGVILLQKGESGGLGLGGGASGAMFTARGAANLLTHVTGVLAALFIGNAILMSIVSNHVLKSAKSILEKTVS